MTFEELYQRTLLVTQRFNNFPNVIDIKYLLREAENDFMKRTACLIKTFTEETSSEESYTAPTLPIDFYEDRSVYWNGYLLRKAGISTGNIFGDLNSNDIITGDPYSYQIDIANQRIDLFPQPTAGGFLKFTYVALNKQADQTSGVLVVGSQYKITNYVSGDDFTNVGGFNKLNNVFIATATTPTDWSNGSTLVLQTLSPIIAESDHIRLVDYAAGVIANINGEFTDERVFNEKFEINVREAQKRHGEMNNRQTLVTDRTGGRIDEWF